jgi:hypothetical protein
MLMRALSTQLAHETSGAARIRHSLRPLDLEGVSYLQSSGAMCRENEKPFLVVPANAGTHTPRPLSQNKEDGGHHAKQFRRWLWVPAFAGTTVEYGITIARPIEPAPALTRAQLARQMHRS